MSKPVALISFPVRLHGNVDRQNQGVAAEIARSPDNILGYLQIPPAIELKPGVVRRYLYGLLDRSVACARQDERHVRRRRLTGKQSAGVLAEHSRRAGGGFAQGGGKS